VSILIDKKPRGLIMDRRNFLMWVGVGWIATSLPVALIASGSETVAADVPSNSGNLESVPVSDEYVTIGTVAKLDEERQIFLKDSPVGRILVVRNPKNAQTLSAVDPKCTHQGCDVNWEEKAFLCPCHASKFDVNGDVLDGPASKPLKTYEAEIQGDSVVVKVKRR
jgi:cytochrome b6-f complex iron-sulfur subunit